jgi:hypothetical protein
MTTPQMMKVLVRFDFCSAPWRRLVGFVRITLDLLLADGGADATVADVPVSAVP